jgi:hypothetical protein
MERTIRAAQPGEAARGYIHHGGPIFSPFSGLILI